MEILGNRTADRRFGEHQLIFAVAGSKTNLNVSVLTVTACLLLVFTFDLNALCDSLTVGNYRRIELYGCTETALELGNDDVKVNIAHTVDEHLLCFGIVFKLNGKVLFEQLGYSL